MIQEDSGSLYREKIRTLYLDTFSTGISAQFIDQEQLDALMNLTYSGGKMYVSVKESGLCGAAFLFPLKYDDLFPIKSFQFFENEKVMYFAELLVDEKVRGKGIGGEMISYINDALKKEGYKFLVIRVWEKNEAALHLYLKHGFSEICRIKQLKKSTDLSVDIEMIKIYLSKQL